MAGMAYTPLQNGERSPYGGGGGKMRARRAPKRNGTPYDRPATGRHASAGPQAAALMNTANGEAAKRDGWLGSRLLGTASKIVTTGASYLYSSFFKRPAGGGMLLLQDAEKPAGDNTEGATDMLSPSAAEAESREGGSQHGEEDKTSEVESWMKRTFPREEAEKLIASLRSYVKENGSAEEQVDHVNNEGQRRPPIMTPAPALALESAPSNGQLTDAQRWREERTKARQEQKSNLWPGGSGKENGTPTGAGTSEVGEVVAVDVARAYMGERVTRVVTPARVTLTREKVNATTPLRLSPYQPSPYLLRKQQATSIATQYESASVPPGGARDRDGGFDDNLRTPPLNRTVGRLLPVSRTNAPSPAIGYPFSGEGSKKRGSAALEDGGYASGGPIRRLRPRSSLYTPSPASGLQRRGGLGIYPPPQPRILQTPTDVKQKSISTWSRNADMEKEDTKGSALGTHASVPERASATARKILETLDMMTPSPKEKSLDTELALVRERPPTELTTSMMNDKARQTMQNWEFPGPPDSEEAGPSGRGRNLESDLSAAGFPWKGAEQGTKARGKGKASATTSTHNNEEKSTDQPSFSFQDTSRSKVPESTLSSPSLAITKNQGFQINADVDDSDEENRGVHANLLTTSVTSTVSFTTKNSTSGSGLFDNNQSRPSNITAPMSGAPIAVESQRIVSEAIDGKLSAAPGGFSFPASNPFGTSLDAPPTPKPFPSPSNTGPPAKSNGVPAYKFNTGSSGDNMFKLPVSHNADDASKANHQRDSTSGFTPSGVSAPETANSTEAAKVEVSSASGPFGSDISTSPPTTTAFTSSTFSLSNFGAPGAGAKPAFAGIFNQNSQTTSSSPGSSSAQATTPDSKNKTGFFNFGKSPSLEPAAVTPASTGAGSMLFGSSTLTSSAATSASPSPAFGSSPAFGMTSAGFAFGSSASSSAAAPALSTAPSATTDDSSRPQKRMFGQEQTKTDDSKVAPATVSFGLSATATTLVTASSSASTFSTTVFGQGAGSSAPAFFSASLPGSKPASDSTLENSSAPSSSPGTSTFGLIGSSTSSSSPGTSTFGSFGSSSPLFGSSMFGSSNAAPAFGGSSAASGASSTPAFGGAFGASNTPTFGASSTPAFGASSTPAFGASSTPAFGASSTPAFGASSTPAFGASSTPAFGASSTPAFGASSTPAFGASSTPAFGASSTPAFGASSSPAFGASSTPAFGASSSPAFGASSTPAFGASSTPAFGASSTPAFGASSTPAFGASSQASQSPSVFGGFGAATNTGSSSSPTTFSFGGGASGSSPFAFGGSSTASPTTSTGAFAFGASSAASPASTFNFGGKPAAAPMFGAGRTTPAFGSSPNGGMGGNDMEDTMADDGQMMASSPPPQQQTSLFGASQTSGSGTTFNFGNPATPVTTPSPVFGGFGAAPAPAPANPFGASPQPTAGANPFGASPQQPSPVGNPFGGSPQPGQPLQFGGGGFSLGATGQDAGPKTTRKFIKAKRAGNVKRKS